MMSKVKSPEHIFVQQKSCPHAWYLVMDSLHDQAVFLYGNASGSAVMHQNDGKGQLISTIDLSHKSVFLLAGFALENAIKAFLVYENPQWISNGRLSGNLRSHDLQKLEKQSRLIPHQGRRTQILRAFQDGLESWARYPCSLVMEDTRDEAVLTLPLWLSYRRLIRTYERRLRQLMESPWKGPHGFEGTYHFVGHGHPPVPAMWGGSQGIIARS
jgi:hypothetical protein